MFILATISGVKLPLLARNVVPASPELDENPISKEAIEYFTGKSNPLTSTRKPPCAANDAAAILPPSYVPTFAVN